MDFQGVCNALAMRTHCSVQVNRRESNSTDSFQFSSLSEIGIRCNRSRDSIDPSPPSFFCFRSNRNALSKKIFLSSFPSFPLFFPSSFSPDRSIKKNGGTKTGRNNDFLSSDGGGRRSVRSVHKEFSWRAENNLL